MNVDTPPSPVRFLSGAENGQRLERDSPEPAREPRFQDQQGWTLELPKTIGALYLIFFTSAALLSACGFPGFAARRLNRRCMPYSIIVAYYSAAAKFRPWVSDLYDRVCNSPSLLIRVCPNVPAAPASVDRPREITWIFSPGRGTFLLPPVPTRWGLG
jgi:hypothetical protein